MKICITSLGRDLDSPVDPRFGRCQYFLFLDEKGELKKVLPNSGVFAARGAGIAAAQQVTNQGVDVLISGNLGPNAFSVLLQTGVKIFLASPGISVREVFSMWKKNKLSQINKPSVPGHFGLGGRFGPRGRGGFKGPGGRRRW